MRIEFTHYMNEMYDNVENLYSLSLSLSHSLSHTLEVNLFSEEPGAHNSLSISSLL